MSEFTGASNHSLQIYAIYIVAESLLKVGTGWKARFIILRQSLRQVLLP